MQVNGELSIVRHIRSIIIAVAFFLAGLAFIGFGIYFIINPAADESGDNSPIASIMLIGMGSVAVAVAVFTVIRVVKTVKSSKRLSEEEVKENVARLDADAPNIPEAENVKLYFHFGGKLNQSFFVEDRNGKTVYECVLKKFNPIGANTFEFTDVDHNYSKTVKIGKTVTTSGGGGPVFVGNELSSRFKIDGVMCWDYLRQRGYEIKHHILDRHITRYELVRLGETVADIVPADMKDPWNEESRKYLRMPKGSYRLEIVKARLEDVVMAAVIIYQTEIIE